ncbi:MAG: hypothetical protein PVF58_12135 [Candidatus Methanofastidiosia archaeon]|jgi:hypothetical protein
MRSAAVVVVVCLLLSGCISQKNIPKIEITVKDPPEEIIVSDTVDITIVLTNEGDAPAYDVALESNIPAVLTFESDHIAQLTDGFTKNVKTTLKGANILKDRESDIIQTVITVKYYDEEENQKIARTMFRFTLRNPDVKIDEIEAGILPGKITAKEHEKVPITVYVKNEENRKMEDLFIVFCSEYEHVTVYRIDIEEADNCFEYSIRDVLWLNDLLAKGFTMEASLPPGADKVTFVLSIKLVWRTEGYEIILDSHNIKVEVKK